MFAITDILTQSVMKPLSEWLFSLLRKLPMDGTFNQGLPLTRLLELYGSGSLVGKGFYSYDLSAATDRLPVAIQRDILSILIGKERAHLWSKLLTDRD